jgi:UDP-N-acetylmuramoyl-tripeptide--D-alanyl-D-alanine ligase
VVGYVGGGLGVGPVVRLWWPDGQAEVSPPFTARHRLENVVAAFAACVAAGLEPSTCLEGLSNVRFSPQRGDESSHAGVRLIDDTYNANPPAMRSALTSLVDRARAEGGRSVAVLGDMLELGPQGEVYHAEVGEYAAQAGVEVLWGVGRYARAMVEAYLAARISGGAADGRWFADADAEQLAVALARLAAELGRGDVVLVKASRGMRLERIVQTLRLTLDRRDA